MALKYNVRSYPTYVFVDPDTGEEIHRSSGRQDAETFLFTGKSALTPQLRSGYLFKTFEQGCSEVDFLLNYAMYMGSIFNSKRVGEICNQLWESGSCTLENEKMWNLFVKYVKGLENPWFKSMLESVDKLRGLYGKESVDAKLYEEAKYEKVKENILSLPDFEGKDVVLMYNDYDSAFRAKNYAEAASSLDALMAYSGALDREVCKFLYYAGRSNLYEEFPDSWHDKCLEVSKFVAYNHPDRSDASIHQLYAMQLEMWAKRMNAKIPSSSLGIQEYSMRPKDLMAKPKR